MKKISLICSTLGDRVNELRFMLNSIYKSSFPKKEIQIIIVNQNITKDNVGTVTKEYEGKLEIKVINQFGKGISRGRNLGFKFAEGEFIGFPDDDCWFSPDFFERLIRVFDLTEAHVILGSIYDPINKRSYPGHKGNRSIKKMEEKDLFYGLSISTFFKRKILEDMIKTEGYLFDENLGVGTYFGCGEETDLIYRLFKTGSKVFIEPSLQVYHKVGFKPIDEVSKIRSYARGIGALARKHNTYIMHRYYMEAAVKSLIAVVVRGIRLKGAFSYYLARFKGLIEGYIKWPEYTMIQDNWF